MMYTGLYIAAIWITAVSFMVVVFAAYDAGNNAAHRRGLISLDRYHHNRAVGYRVLGIATVVGGAIFTIGCLVLKAF